MKVVMYDLVKAIDTRFSTVAISGFVVETFFVYSNLTCRDGLGCWTESGNYRSTHITVICSVKDTSMEYGPNFLQFVINSLFTENNSNNNIW